MRRGLCRAIGWSLGNWSKRGGRRSSGAEAYRCLLYEDGVEGGGCELATNAMRLAAEVGAVRSDRDAQPGDDEEPGEPNRVEHRLGIVLEDCLLRVLRVDPAGVFAADRVPFDDALRLGLVHWSWQIGGYEETCIEVQPVRLPQPERAGPNHLREAQFGAQSPLCRHRLRQEQTCRAPLRRERRYPQGPIPGRQLRGGCRPSMRADRGHRQEAQDRQGLHSHRGRG